MHLLIFVSLLPTPIGRDWVHKDPLSLVLPTLALPSFTHHLCAGDHEMPLLLSPKGSTVLPAEVQILPKDTQVHFTASAQAGASPPTWCHNFQAQLPPPFPQLAMTTFFPAFKKRIFEEKMAPLCHFHWAASIVHSTYLIFSTQTSNHFCPSLKTFNSIPSRNKIQVWWPYVMPASTCFLSDYLLCYTSLSISFGHASPLGIA